MVSVAEPDLAASLYSEAGLAGQQDRERQRTKNMIYETSTHSSESGDSEEIIVRDY